jgi:2-oxoglutarate ferredoxin oxidoreductase subunit alpha
MPRSKFRDDVNVIGMPLTEICNRTYTDPRQRQLFKNIIYVGALSALLDMDPAEIEKLFAEQYRGKEALLQSNVKALKLGRDYAFEHLSCPLGLRIRRADAVGERIFVDGNSAAALGAVYGGASVCAWYPITPSSSLAEAFIKYCQRYRTDPDTKRARHAIIQGEDELASVGIAIGAGWNGARSFTTTSGPGISLMSEFIGLAYFAEIPVVLIDVQRGGPSTGHAHAHPAVRSALLRVCLARRHETRAAVPGRSRGVLQPDGTGIRPRGAAADAGLRADRSRHRHEPAVVRSVPVGRQEALRPWQGDDLRRPGVRARLRALPRRRRRRGVLPHLPRGPIPRAAAISRVARPRTATRATPRPVRITWTTCSGLQRKFETAKSLVPRPLLYPAEKPARFGAIFYGSTSPSMTEALDVLAERGIHVNALRVRGFPSRRR